MTDEPVATPPPPQSAGQVESAAVTLVLDESVLTPAPLPEQQEVESEYAVAPDETVAEMALHQDASHSAGGTPPARRGFAIISKEVTSMGTALRAITHREEMAAAESRRKRNRTAFFFDSSHDPDEVHQQETDQLVALPTAAELPYGWEQARHPVRCARSCLKGLARG